MNPSRPTANKIRRRAYQLYRDRGGRPGHEIDDWLQAEYELTQLPIRKLAELPQTDQRNAASPIIGLVHLALFIGENI